MAAENASPSNPYDPPPEQEPIEPTDENKIALALRLTIYLHLVFIVGCVLLTLTDIGQLTLDDWAHTVLWKLSYPLVFSWMVFPAITYAFASQAKRRSKFFCVAITLFDVSLSMFQFWVCFPLVQ